MPKKIKTKNYLNFLLELFNAELEERDRKRRNVYMKAAKFDILKTFEDYSFEDIKFPKALSPDDVNVLIEAKRQGELSRFMKQLDKLNLLICDEWG